MTRSVLDDLVAQQKKVDQRISDLDTTNARAIQCVFKRKNVDISQEKYGAKFSLPISKPLLTEKHRQKRLDGAHAAGDTDWNQIIFSDETTVRVNQLKRCVWNLPGKRKVFRTVKGEYLEMFFMQRLWPYLLFP